MIKATAGNTIIFGLSDRNIELLKNGNPIRFNLKDLGLPDREVIIFNGKDEETMYKTLQAQYKPEKEGGE